MVLSRFSRVMIGTKTYLDLLIELSSILGIRDFSIMIKRQRLNYKIMEMRDLNYKKLKYPKKFRKTIYDAEPRSLITVEDDEGESFPVNMLGVKDESYSFYRVKITESHIQITDLYLTEEDKNKRFDYFVQAPLEDTSQYLAWIYKSYDDDESSRS